MLNKKFKRTESTEEPLISILLEDKAKDKSIPFSSLQIAAINSLKNMMAITENKKNGIITANIQSESPSLSTEINYAIKELICISKSIIKERLVKLEYL